MFKKESLTILLLFGLVLFVRVVYVPTGKVWFDEIVSIMAAKQGVSEIFELASAETNTPTYYILLHYYMRVFGDSEATLRLLSVFFGFLSSLIIFLTIRELTRNTLVPKIALFLAAVSPFHLYYSHEIRVYSLLVFLSSLTLLSLIKGLHSKAPKTFWEVCYAVSIVLGAYLHITYLFYILALDVFLLVKVFRERRRDLLVNNLLLPNALLMGSMVAFYIMRHPLITKQIINVVKTKGVASGNPVYGAFASVEDFLSTITRVYWGKIVAPSVLVATTVFLYWGLKGLRVKGDCAFLFITILATSVLIQPRLPSSNRYMAYAFPAVVVLLAFGIHRLWTVLSEFSGGAFKVSRVLVACALVLAVILSIQVSIDSRSSRYSCLASFFEENRHPEAVILVVPSWDRYLLLHYLEEPLAVKGVHTSLDKFGRGLSLAENLGANWQPVVDEQTVANLENYIEGFRDVWYINFDQSSDPENWALRWLVENANLKKIHHIDCSNRGGSSNPATRIPVFLFRNEEI